MTTRTRFFGCSRPIVASEPRFIRRHPSPSTTNTPMPARARPTPSPMDEAMGGQANGDLNRSLIRKQERIDRVERSAQTARLQHNRRTTAAEIHTRRDAERLLFARREHEPHVAKAFAEIAQHVRERIVRH